jgi:hypothetical protein
MASMAALFFFCSVCKRGVVNGACESVYRLSTWGGSRRWWHRAVARLPSSSKSTQEPNLHMTYKPLCCLSRAYVVCLESFLAITTLGADPRRHSRSRILTCDSTKRVCGNSLSGAEKSKLARGKCSRGRSINGDRARGCACRFGGCGYEFALVSWAKQGMDRQQRDCNKVQP